MKNIIAGLMLAVLAVEIGRADSVNPASNVTADSANTAGTIVYRDSSGNFAAGTITATAVTAATSLTVSAGKVSVSTAAVGATALVLDGSYSTVQLRLKTPTAVGQIIFNTTLGNICVSTGTATAEAYKLAGTASTTCE